MARGTLRELFEIIERLYTYAYNEGGSQPEGQEATAGGEGQTPTRGVGNPKEWIPPDFPPAEPRDPL